MGNNSMLLECNSFNLILIVCVRINNLFCYFYLFISSKLTYSIFPYRSVQHSIVYTQRILYTWIIKLDIEA